MKSLHYLEEIVKLQKQGVPRGIYSICSANRFVIEASLEQGLKDDSHVLIEATCNQVNQFGGYTGMKPRDFVKFVQGIADKVQFPREKLILGGDHLGPSPWKKEHAEAAMEKAAVLVKEYVSAGFTKIHLDPSMHLAADDDTRTKPLDPVVIAERTALLCAAAEETFEKAQKMDVPPVYVIGTEVPVPGGIQDASEVLHVTEVAEFKTTVAVSKKAFSKKRLSDAWERVIAVVVQPGVEYGDQTIYAYQPENAQSLCHALKAFPTLVFEGHSTDYQQGSHLKQMVADGIAILKVGPALTFAMREALFLLQYLEAELLQDNASLRRSNLINVLDEVMVSNPVYWKEYYHGNRKELQFARKYSLSDRSRYYWTNPDVQKALEHLFNNLEHLDIPLSLISQFFPRQYEKIREGSLENHPKALVKDKIKDVLRTYSYAITPEVS